MLRRILCRHFSDACVLQEAEDEQQQRRDQRGLCGGVNEEAEIRGAQATRVIAPCDCGREQPLKRDGGSVDGEAIHRSDLRHTKQAAHADGAAPGYENAEHGED